MGMIDYKYYRNRFSETLMDGVLPFWEKYSPDRIHGGYFTCLLQGGQVYDTDKFVWLQARQVWTFSMLYNQLEQRESWLEMALLGADFLQKHGQDKDGNWYFALQQNGKPLVQPYNIFSDCFAAMAFSQLFQATGVEEYAALSRKTFQNILKRQDHPKGIYEKQVPGSRPLRGFSLPMILCNLCLELEPLLDKKLIEHTIDQCIHQVMDVFYDEATGLVLENVERDGGLSETFPGRLLNPGHALEAMWFIMDLGERRQDQALIEEANKRALFMLDYGWDKEQQGVFYFMDRLGYPPEQLEWNQKLWWVHLEAIEACLKGYLHTGHPKNWEWFEKIFAYSWSHFNDPEFGEWFGYLQRDGSPLHTGKGGKWKGCFHVPRALWHGWQTLEKIMAQNATSQ